jgi:hypothetical protein
MNPPWPTATGGPTPAGSTATPIDMPVIGEVGHRAM